MVTVAAFGALAAGFAAVMLAALGLRALLRAATPEFALPSRHPGPGYAITNLGGSLLAAAAGGYATAALSRGNPLVEVLALSIIILAFAALSALQSRGQYPIWYQLAQVAISPAGVLGGGLVRLRAEGIL